MAENSRRSWRRRWTVALVIVILTGAIGALLLSRFLRPERLTRFLQSQAKSMLDAKLTLGANAGFDFVPKLHLVLPHPALARAGAAAFVSADSADIVVPWSTLWSDRIVIERIDLARPRIDLDALNAWLASRPPSNQALDIRFALRARDATVTSGGKPLAEHVDVDLASAGDVLGWLASLDGAALPDPSLPPIDGSVDAASVEIGGTRIEGLHVESRADGGARETKSNPSK